MSAPDSNKDNTQDVVGEDDNAIQNPPPPPPPVSNQDNVVPNVPALGPPGAEMRSVQGDESIDKEMVPVPGNEPTDKEMLNIQGDEPTDKEMVNIQGDASNDSEVTANINVARSRMLSLELGSPTSMCCTVGTDETPTLSTLSISPDNPSGTSCSGDSRFPDSSVGTSPLDSPQMVQAILALRTADSPSESSATALPTMRAVLTSGSDTSPSPTMESGDGSTGKKQMCASLKKVKDSSPDVSQAGTPVDVKHPVRAVRQVHTPVSTPGSKQSPAGSVEPSRQSSLEKTDSSMSPSGSRDTETDNADADVSSMSPMSVDNKKKVLTKWRPQRAPTMSDIINDFLDQPYPSPVQDRADTLDDADTLALDSQSVRSSIPERGASVIFPSGKSIPIPPDRDRRAISLPVGSDEKVQKPVVVQRRAISEIPDDSRSNPDLPPPSESPDVSLPVSPDRERRAISLPPVQQENLSIDVRDQRRALSEVPEISRSTDMPPSASPDDVPLPSPLVSSSCSSSQHASDVSLDTSKDKSSDQKNGKSQSTDSSLPTEEVNAILPDLQGWLNRGAFRDDRHLTSGQQGPSRVTEEPVVQPVPVEVIKERLTQSSSREESSNLSSLSDLTRSDVGEFGSWFQKGAYTDDRHLTTGQQSGLPGQTGGKVKTEKGSTPLKTAQSTTGSRLTVPTEVKEGSGSSSEMQVEETKEKDPLQSEDSSKDPEPQPSTSRHFLRSAKTKTVEVQRTPKRKRVTDKSKRDSSDPRSSSSDPKSNVPVSPEDDMATKKYCSEFNRPFTRQLARSHSTGSVRDAYLKKRGLKGFKEEQKSSEKDSDDESSDDEK